MKALTDLKQEAIKLRKKGLSYNEIRKQVNVAKSSLSLWLKDIELKEEHRKRLYTKQIQILSRGSQSQKERRKREIQEILKSAKEEIPTPLSKDTYRLMGAALYWAEGSKGGLCQVTNSDPRLISFMVAWFESMLGIKVENLKARINIYPQQDETKLKKFWSELTGIPVKRFGKSFIKPANKGFKKNNLYYGTARIEVPKSVDFKHRIFGWINSVLKDNKKVELVQRKWQSLAQVERPFPVNLKVHKSKTSNKNGLLA